MAQIPASPDTGARTRWLRTAGIVAALLVAVAVLLVAALTAALRSQRVADLIREQITSATGRDAAFDGGLQLDLWPRIAVVANGFWLANAPGASSPRMLTARRVAFAVALAPLLERRIVVESVEVEGAELRIEMLADGRSNWRLDAKPAAPAAPADAGQAPAQLRVEQVRLTDARLTFVDAPGKPPQTLDLASASLAVVNERSEVDAAFALRGQSWRLHAVTGRMEALATRREAWPFEAELTTPGLRVGLRGEIPPAHGASVAEGPFRVDAQLTGAAALAPWVGTGALPPLPLSVRATVAARADTWRIDSIEGSVAGDAFKGRLTLALRAKPEIGGALRFATLDLKHWQPAAAAPAAGRAPQAAAGQAPSAGDAPLFPAAGWPIVGALDFAVDRLVVPQWPAIHALALRVKLTPERLDIPAASLEVAGGRVKASGHVELKPRTEPELSLRLETGNLSLKALGDTAGQPGAVRSGEGRVTAALTGRGNSARALMSHVTGDFVLSLTDVALGEKSSFWRTDLILGVLKRLTPADAKRADLLRCVVVRLPLRDGLATIDRSIALETSELDVVAVGRVDLRTQTLDLAFRPTPKKGVGLNPASLAQFVKLQGPIAAPEYAIDVAGSARGAVSIGAAVATGGLTLLGERALHRAVDPNPCQTALQR